MPFASSNEATNTVPTARGKNVTTAPLLVWAFHAFSSIAMDIGPVELKGRTVSESGSAGGDEAPEKETLNEPHCEIEENEIVLNARTSCRP